MRTLTIALTVFIVRCCIGNLSLAAEYHVKQNGLGDFTTIQEAIDAARNGDAVIVHPGLYYENIRFNGKNIALRSLDPDDEETVASTLIDGQQRDSVVTFAGTEGETCLLSGFTITNGQGVNGGGILPTI